MVTTRLERVEREASEEESSHTRTMSGTASEQKKPEAVAAAAPVADEASKKSSKPVAEEAPKQAAEKKATESSTAVVSKEQAKNSQSLLMVSMMLEGVVFGSLFGWAVIRHEGIKAADTKKYLGIASVLSPLLVMDRDCCRHAVSNNDIGLFAINMVLALRSWFERSLEAFGPWSTGTVASDNVFAVVAFFAHFRAFLHLLTKEARGSSSKRLALMAGFALGANLTVY